MVTLLGGTNAGKKPSKIAWLSRVHSGKLTSVAVLYEEYMAAGPYKPNVEPLRITYIEVQKADELVCRLELVDVDLQNKTVIEAAKSVGVTPFFLAMAIVAGYSY